jgi:hypothetical protein
MANLKNFKIIPKSCFQKMKNIADSLIQNSLIFQNVPQVLLCG